MAGSMNRRQDSSDDSDDELMEIVVSYLEMEAMRRPRTLRDRGDPITDYDDVDFRMRYRLPKEAVLGLMERIGDELSHHNNRYAQVSPVNQLLLALRFYATGSFLVRTVLFEPDIK
jgi:hypothetical protein